MTMETPPDREGHVTRGHNARDMGIVALIQGLLSKCEGENLWRLCKNYQTTEC